MVYDFQIFCLLVDALPLMLRIGFMFSGRSVVGMYTC